MHGRLGRDTDHFIRVGKSVCVCDLSDMNIA